MTVRVVVYAEGAADRAGELGLPPVPGAGLIDVHLGAAHHLVRRVVADVHGVPPAAVQFEAPRRGPRGRREATGSDLLARETVRQLLTWFEASKRPDLAVVLVDADGKRERYQLLRDHIADLPVRPVTVVGVAVEELESWLIADPVAAQVGEIADVESLHQGEAKQLLNAHVPQGVSLRDARIAIARSADLAVMRARARSFERFSADVAAVPVPGSQRR